MIYNDIALNDDWDIQLSSNGDFKIYSDADALAQTIAVECRVALRDKYFDADNGVNYQSILGSKNQTNELSRDLRSVTEKIDGVLNVLSVELLYFDVDSRTVVGNIIVTKEDGEVIEVEL